MKTVLIIAYECAPYHRPGSTIGAQRPYQFAKHLHKYGWNAIVLCSDFSTRYSLDPNLNWKDDVRHFIKRKIDQWSGNETLIIGLPSLQYADKIDKTWLDGVLFNKTSGTFVEKSGTLKSIKRRFATLLKLFTGDHSQSWQDVALCSFEEIMSLGIKIDIILAEHSPDASLFVANRISKKTGLPWIADFRDPIDRDLNWLQKIIYRNFTVPIFRSSAATITVNSYLSLLNQDLFKNQGHVILNGFDEAELRVEQEDLDRPPQQILTIGYFGTFQRGQNIVPFLDGLAALGTATRVKFIYRGGSESVVNQYLNSRRSASIEYDVAGQIERTKSVVLSTQCDILLLLSLRIPNDLYLKNGLYPGKAFEYFGLRKPVLVVPGDSGMLNQLIEDNKVGKIAATSDRIKQLLEDAFREKTADVPIWNIQYSNEVLQKFTREFQTEELATLLNYYSKCVA